MRRLVRKLVLAWADKIKGVDEERVKKHKAAVQEAHDYVIDQIVGAACIHGRSSPARLPYCDDCPIGDMGGDLSYGASRMICNRTRRYSK